MEKADVANTRSSGGRKVDTDQKKNAGEIGPHATFGKRNGATSKKDKPDANPNVANLEKNHAEKMTRAHQTSGQKTEKGKQQKRHKDNDDNGRTMGKADAGDTQNHPAQ